MSVQSQSEVLRALQKAHRKLGNVIRYMNPKGGISIAYALSDARDAKGIAVARGTTVGFGIDENITRVLLTVRRYDKEMRACACIRCTDEILEYARVILLDVASFDVQTYPKGISSMDWGISFMCKDNNNEVPLAIASLNNPDLEDCLYVFGNTPEEAANRILILSERLSI